MLTGRGTVSMELNIADICDALAGAYPERECLIFRDRRLTWADVADRTDRLAAILQAAGLGRTRPFAGSDGWESTQDHVALYLHNGNEYLEGMLGAYKAVCAPVNVNYRYRASELAYVLRDSGAKAIVFHSAFAPLLAEVLPDLPSLTLLLQVVDSSGNPLLADVDAATVRPPNAPPAKAKTQDEIDADAGVQEILNAVNRGKRPAGGAAASSEAADADAILQQVNRRASAQA